MDTIVGNCDTTLFLGGKEKTTLKEMSDILGKETIHLLNTGESRGQSASYSMNYQSLGKDLLSMDEISVMDGSKCILQVRGVRPFLSTKYDIEKHHNYKYLSDSDPSKAFNIVEFVRVFKENKAILLEGLNKKNTKHVRIEINDDDVETETVPTPKTVPLSVPVITDTPTEDKTKTAELPDNQNEIKTHDVESEDDDEDDFDPDDTELV